MQEVGRLSMRRTGPISLTGRGKIRNAIARIFLPSNSIQGAHGFLDGQSLLLKAPQSESGKVNRFSGFFKERLTTNLNPWS